MTLELLRGIRVISLAINLPGPLAAARLTELGADVVKVIPPTGDPLAWVSPDWHDVLQRGQEVVELDLKSAEGRGRLDELLAGCDLLLTSMRPQALARLGLTWSALSARYPRLCQVAIVGYPSPHGDRAGHDLTYQATAGLLVPPAFPTIPLADYAASEQAVSMALSLILARERAGQDPVPAQERWAEVSLVGALRPYADALRYGLFAAGTFLAGGFPLYGFYRAREGWVALAALEPHFNARLAAELGLDEFTRENLAEAFLARSADEWEAWAIEQDVPLAAVREP